MFIPHNFESDFKSSLNSWESRDLKSALLGLTIYWKSVSNKYKYPTKLWKEGAWLHKLGSAQHIHHFSICEWSSGFIDDFEWASKLMDEAKSLLKKREDYKFIMMDCYSNNRAISPLLFLDVYQYTTEYLGRHSPAMFSNSINEIDGISLLDFNQVIAVSSEFCAPIFRPTKFIRVNSEAEDECLPGIGTI